MINYAYESLFRQDSVDKQLHITDGDSVNLTNLDIYQEEFELEEILSPNRDLTYGSCNSARVKFTTSYLGELKGKTLTISVVLNNHTDDPFVFGTYKVYEDKFTADRTKKEVVCYDALYDVLNANVIDWYNTILPDFETTVTLKQFRDSFFSNFGITQETITLDNDSATISKTVGGTLLSGSDVIHCICEMNGCFGRINRSGNFEYFYVHATSHPLYPALNLYPSLDLFPRFDGDYDATEVGEGGTYISAEYEDFSCMPVDKLIIRQEENDIGVEVGTGTNAYTIQGNFLLYDKGTAELTPIAENIFTHIGDGSYYRPCQIELKGNPCVEIGDGISLTTSNGTNIITFVTCRIYRGIQAQRDIYISEGTQYRDEQVNSIDAQLYQLRGKSNILERSIEETNSTITNDILDGDNPTSLQSQITQTATEVSAKVSTTDHNSQNTFGWTLDTTGFDVKANGNSVFKVNENGAEIKGKVKADSGYIGNFEIENGYIKGYDGSTETCALYPRTGSLHGLNVTGEYLDFESEQMSTLESKKYVTLRAWSKDFDRQVIDITSKFLINLEVNEYSPSTTAYLSSTDFTLNTVVRAVNFITTSDRKLKKNIKELDAEKAVKLILSLKPCEYNLKSNGEKHHGFIAQEVEELVTDDWSIVSESTPVKENEESYKAIAYTELIADLVATVQNQQKQIDELRNEINKLTEGDLK